MQKKNYLYSPPKLITMSKPFICTCVNNGSGAKVGSTEEWYCDSGGSGDTSIDCYNGTGDTDTSTMYVCDAGESVGNNDTCNDGTNNYNASGCASGGGFS